MARRILSELIVKLIDGVSGESKKVATSFKQIEKAAIDFAKSGKALGDWGNRFSAQLARLRATPAEIGKIRSSWERLQATLRSGKFDDAFRTHAVRRWQAEHVRALMTVRRQAEQTHGVMSRLRAVMVPGKAAVGRMGAALAMSRPLSGYAPGLTAGFGLYKAHRDLLEWGTALNTLRATNPDETADTFNRIADAAIRTASAFKVVGRSDVLKAATTLAKAGQSLASVEASLGPITQAAVAAGANPQEMAQQLVQLARMARMPIGTPEDASNTYRTLSNLGAYVEVNAPGTFNDYLQAMKFVGANMAIAKNGLRAVTQLYILLDQAGVKGMRAGVNIRQLFRHLAAPRADALAMYKQLGWDTGEFLTKGKAIDPEEVIRALSAKYGRDFTKLKPRIGQIIGAGKGDAETSEAIFRAVERAWGRTAPADARFMKRRQWQRMKPSDAKGVKKSIDDALRSGAEGIDVAKWFEGARQRNLTLGQAIKLLEPRQAASTLSALREAVESNEDLDKLLTTPLGTLPGLDDDLSRRQSEEKKQGYPGAVGRLQQAWTSLLDSMERAGVIEGIASTFERLGTAIENIAKGTASAKDIAIGAAGALALLAPFIPKMLALAGALAPFLPIAMAAWEVFGDKSDAQKNASAALQDWMKGGKPLEQVMKDRGLPTGWGDLFGPKKGALTDTLKEEGDRAAEEAISIRQRLMQILNFTARPRIDLSPEPGGGDLAPSAAPLEKRSMAPMSNTFNLAFHGVQDVDKIADQVGAVLNQKVREQMAGIFADYGVEMG